MNLTKAFQAAVAVTAIALSIVSASSFAATADSPLSLRTCTVKGNCDPPDPNGPSLDGFVAPAGVKQHGQHDMNGPSLDGFATPKQLKSCPSKGNCDLPDQNGPSLDGFAPAQTDAPSLRTCTIKNNCDLPDPNGPSLDGFVVPAGVKQHDQYDLNGPSLDGFADTSVGHDSKAPSIKTCPSKGNCDFPDQNGPSLDGFAAPTQLKTCTIKNNCDVPDPNGPSLNGLADLKIGTVVIAIHTP